MRKLLFGLLGLLWVLPVMAVDYRNCQNLFDGEYISINDGGKAENANNIYVSPGEQYVALWTTSLPSALNLYGYDTQGNIVNSWTAGWYASSTPFSDNYMAWQSGAVFTVPDDVAYLRFNTFGSLDALQQQAWAESLKIYNMNCVEKITIATTKYVESEFSPLNTALANAVATVNTVVTQTIAQAASIATLQSGKQTRPADNAECPAYKQCLLVEDENGTPHWYQITDPFRDFVAPIIANNVNGASDVNTQGYTQLEYIESTGTQWIDTGYKFTTNNHKYIVKFSNVSAGSMAAPYWLWGSNMGSDRRSGTMVLQISGKLGFGVGNMTAGTSSYTINNPTSPITLTVETKDNNTFSISGGSTDYTNVPFEGSTITNFNEALFGNMLGVSSIGFTSSYKLHNAKIYENNTLVRNFVPVLNHASQKFGMYDTVGGRFYGNAASSGDDFTPGPIVENDPNVPTDFWSVTWVANATTGVTAGTVRGTGICNSVTGSGIGAKATNAQMASSDWNVLGKNCWCQITGLDTNSVVTSIDTNPFSMYTEGTNSQCYNNCTYVCKRNISTNVNDSRSVIFGQF